MKSVLNFFLKMLRHLGLPALAAVLLAACPCAADDAGSVLIEKDRGSTVTIAVSTIGPTHSWAASVYDHAKKVLEEVAEDNGWNWILVSADSASEQSDQVVELVRRNVSCLVLLPMDGASLKTAAIIAQQAGIPLVIFDREVPDFAPAATIKGDNSGIGMRVAEYLNNSFPKGTTVLEIMGDTSTVPFQRTDGFDETIAGSFTKIQLGFTDWEREKTKEMFRTWIRTQPAQVRRSIGAIFTHDDELVLGVLEVLDEYREAGSLAQMFPNLRVLTGSSGSAELFERMKTEEAYDIISLSYWPQMIEEAVHIGEKIILGEDYPEMTVVPTELISTRNVDSYTDRGFPSVAERDTEEERGS